MEQPIIGALICFALGVVICFFNFKLTEYFIKTKPEKFSLVSVIRQVIQVLYLVLIFFVAKYTPWDRTVLLIGAALGVTLPMFLFTYRLLNENKKTKPENHNKKEGDNNG